MQPVLRSLGLPRLSVAAAVAVALVLALVTPGRAAQAAPGADPAVGVQVHAMWSDMDDETRQRTFALLAGAGATWVRVDIGWSSIEAEGPTPSGWWTEKTREVLQDARDRGLQPLVTLWRTPDWANAGAGVYAPPTDAREFERFTRWFATEFGGLVGAYEIWNEPNEDNFFDGTPADYVRVLEAGYRGIHSGDRDATVVLGGPAYNDTEWLQQVYDLGGGDAFDVLATHPYQAPSDTGPDTPDVDGDNIWLLTHVEAVRELMVREGDAHKDIWFTEFGWFTRPGRSDHPANRPVSETAQAANLVRTIDLVAERYPYVTHVFWYNARDRASGNPRNDSFGLLRRDLTPKPALNAMRARLVDSSAEATRTGASTADRPADPSTARACGDVEPIGSYSDLGSSVHGGNVDCMYAWSVVTDADGTSGRFRIGDRADRAFIAAVIDRLVAAAGAPLPAASTGRFSDVAGHRHEGAITRVAAAGISTGFSDGTYRPDASLTRAQMATLLATTYRYLGYEVPAELTDAFGDDNGNVHEDNIDLVAALSIASGTSAGAFTPGATLTRGQLTTFAARVADHAAANGASPAA